jgi:hypothetical protein
MIIQPKNPNTTSLQILVHEAVCRLQIAMINPSRVDVVETWRSGAQSEVHICRVLSETMAD